MMVLRHHGGMRAGLLVLALAGCESAAVVGAGATPPAQAGVPAGRPDVVVRAESGAAVLTVNDSAALIETTWKRPEAADRAVVEVLTPRGELYLSETVPVDGAGKAQVRLALRGTPIEDYGMHGTWLLRVYRNQGRAPAVEATFEVEREPAQP